MIFDDDNLVVYSDSEKFDGEDDHHHDHNNDSEEEDDDVVAQYINADEPMEVFYRLRGATNGSSRRVGGRASALDSGVLSSNVFSGTILWNEFSQAVDSVRSIATAEAL